MGCAASLPSDAEFLAPQSVGATGCLLGGIADTTASNIIIRFPPLSGLDPWRKGGSFNLAMTDATGAVLAQVTFTKQFKGLTIVRDPAGAILAVLQTTTTSQDTLSGMSTNEFITFGARPRFDGQQPAFAVENVNLFPWIKATRPGGMMTLHNKLSWATAGGWAEPAFSFKWWIGAPPQPFKVTAADSTGAALGRKTESIPKQSEITVAQGMDAGAVLCALMMSTLLIAEMPQREP